MLLVGGEGTPEGRVIAQLLLCTTTYTREFSIFKTTREEREEIEGNGNILSAALALYESHQLRHAELDFLLQAVLAGDPTEQIVLRIQDMKKDTERVLKMVEGK